MPRTGFIAPNQIAGLMNLVRRGISPNYMGTPTYPRLSKADLKGLPMNPGGFRNSYVGKKVRGWLGYGDKPRRERRRQPVRAYGNPVRGNTFIGKNRKRKSFKSRSFKKKRPNKLRKKVNELAKKLPPINTLKITNQTGSLAANNAWTYRMCYFFNNNGNAAGSGPSPFLSRQHMADMYQLMQPDATVLLSAESILKMEYARDTYIVRAPSNNPTMVEVFVLKLKKPLPDIFDTTSAACGPLFDLGVNETPGAIGTVNPGNIRPYRFFSRATNFPTGVVASAGNAAFDAGTSLMNFHPNHSQRFKSNYTIEKTYKFKLGPNDEARFSVSAKNKLLKYEDYVMNPILPSGSEDVCEMIPKHGRLVMFRWHGDLTAAAPGTGAGGGDTAVGAYCSMGWSADRLLVRVERVSKVRKFTQNLLPITQWENTGSTTVGSGFNLVATNADLREYGEDNNTGVAPP